VYSQITSNPEELCCCHCKQELPLPCWKQHCQRKCDEDKDDVGVLHIQPSTTIPSISNFNGDGAQGSRSSVVVGEHNLFPVAQVIITFSKQVAMRSCSCSSPTSFQLSPGQAVVWFIMFLDLQEQFEQYLKVTSLISTIHQAKCAKRCPNPYQL